MKALLIGTGMVAPTHIAALQASKSVSLMGVLGRNETASQALATQAKVPAFSDLGTALANKPDFAILITPPNARLPFAAALTEAKIPTLMEKPIERSLKAAQEIVSLYASSALPLGICFQHRARAGSKRLKALLNSGQLGKIIHLDIQVPWWRDQRYYDDPGRGTYARDGGGVMISQAIHSLDLGLWLAGPVTHAHSIMRTSPLHQMEAEDIAAGLLHFASGATGHIFATTAAFPGGAETLSLITEKARVVLQGDHLSVAFTDGRTLDERPLDTGTGGGADPMAFTHEWHQTIIEDFAQAIVRESDHICSGQDALHVHAVIDAMERAAKSKQQEEVLQCA